MNRSINELKIRAKKIQKLAIAGNPTALALIQKTPAPDGEIKRKTCLHSLAVTLGFRDWTHAKTALSGEGGPDCDMGTFWYSNRCSSFLNNWFAHYQEAKDFLHDHPDMYLLPYKNQFMVVSNEYIREINLYEDCGPIWNAIKHNSVEYCGSDFWHDLVWHRIVRQLA